MMQNTICPSDHGQLTDLSQIVDVFDIFPQDQNNNILHAFAYGSGVFDQQIPTVENKNEVTHTTADNVTAGDGNQSNNQSSLDSSSNTIVSPLPMLDLILVVEDAQSFHDANLEQNRHHYSIACRALGPTGCTFLQRRFGGGVFFVNTTIPVVDASKRHTSSNDKRSNEKHQHHCLRRLKYGVIQESELQSDLTDWNALYIAGRMQKPTLPIQLSRQNNSNSNLSMPLHLYNVQQSNLQSAVLVACCLLLSDPKGKSDPSNHSHSQPLSASSSSLMIPWSQLFERICSLSYSGDFRMTIGAEDPQKIQRLVHGPGQLQRFHQLYQLPLQTLQCQGLVQFAPQGLGLEIPMEVAHGGKTYKTVPDMYWNVLPQHLQAQVEKHQTLRRALQAIVGPAARSQALKGLVTAGLGPSIRYAAAKFAKGRKKR